MKQPPSTFHLPPSTRNLKVAIAHDWLLGGGAEQVVLELHKMFPEAPIYTSYCSDEWRDKLDGKVVTGYLQKWPFSRLRKFLPLLRQRWFKKLDLSDYDLIISSSGNGEAKFVSPSSNFQLPSSNMQRPLHVCYCHSPVHFYWRHYDNYLKNPGFRPKWLVRIGLKLLVKPLRERDYQAAQKVDYFIANSTHIQSDIKKYYGRDSTVIHPPVDTSRFSNSTFHIPSSKKRGFVTVGRLVPNKRTDLIIQACNQLKLPLTVIGYGPELGNLKRIAGDTITFNDNATNQEIEESLASAKAFIFASLEDFGIAPVEAMASGTPVIAYQAGGALDYVIEGKTGTFFKEQTVDSLVRVLRQFPDHSFDPGAISKTARQFDQKHFRQAIKAHLKRIGSKGKK
ncbi:MAG: glycosyltransferase [Candidatus Saccharibacteria bacterium]|nr:glycosyltransferase [Candidatus Saccharibacteria bacterium]